MVVDDDVMNQIAMGSVLKGVGAICDTSNSGYQALEMFQSRITAHKKNGVPLYKVMLIDYSMPGMSGPELAVKIFELADANGYETPYMCCCTAYSDQVFKQKALMAGMKKFMTKPVSSELIEEVLLKNNLKLDKSKTLLR